MCEMPPVSLVWLLSVARKDCLCSYEFPGYLFWNSEKQTIYIKRYKHGVSRNYEIWRARKTKRGKNKYREQRIINLQSESGVANDPRNSRSNVETSAVSATPRIKPVCQNIKVGGAPVVRLPGVLYSKKRRMRERKR